MRAHASRGRAGRLAPALALPALLAAAGSAGAQPLLDATVRGGVQAASYSFESAGSARTTVSEIAIPVAVTVPLFGRLSLDISSAFARAQVKSGSEESTISGPADTQLRTNFSFPGDFLVLTAGLNVPTGIASVDSTQESAASQIGNDFLAFPISNMGIGWAGTLGVAAARPFGSWNVGFGASGRRSFEYEALSGESSSGRVLFQPADEIRARFGVDRAVGRGRAAFGLTYSAFGNDEVQADAVQQRFAFATGDRMIVQAAYVTPVRNTDLSFSAWNLYRAKGRTVLGEASPENIANVAASAGFRMGFGTIEPNVEARVGTGYRSGLLTTGGLRARLDAGGLAFFPGLGYTVGTFQGEAPPGGARPAEQDVRGWRASLTMRMGR